MHVVQISFQVDNLLRPPEQLLRDWYSLEYVADAATAGGHRVTVVQACFHRHWMRRRGVDYHFVPPDGERSLVDGDFAALVAAQHADVFHVHGLGFHEDVLALRARVPSVPILLQDHADRPPRFFWRRARWRRGFSAVNSIAFCAPEQADAWDAAGLLPKHVKVCAISQWSVPFTPGDRAAARAQSGLTGDPCVLWVGHLNENKDPLTVLEAVSLAARELPGLQLWCCFGNAPLLPAVERRIAADTHLRDRVHLLGQVPHERMEALLRSADVFVLGSHREGSGCALIEAMACGLPPVVTDIPSFRALTGNATVGRLWPRGDARACARAMIAVSTERRDAMRAATRAHFEATASPAALGRQLDAVYQRVRGRA